MKHNGSIRDDTTKQPKKSILQVKVERVIKKADKKHYFFNDMELAIFEALGRANWDEEKINWIALEGFERLYAKFYPK